MQLIVLTGLPGSGKSSIAEALGRALAIPVFSKDWLEAVLLHCALQPAKDGAPGIGHAGYELLTTLARRQLQLGQSAILDSVASTESIRDDRDVCAFLALTTALSTPFWVLGRASARQILPGLPLSALMTVCPLAAAALLTYRRRGYKGVAALLGRALDAWRIPSPAWYLPALLLNPAVAAAVYGWQRLSGAPVPPFKATAAEVGALALLFLVAAVGEEVGWSGYALDPLLRHRGPLGAGLALGALGAAWHIIPYLQAGRSRGWIAWQCAKTVASRVLIVQLYTRAGRSVCATVLFHASDNLSVFLYPRAGSHYDPRVTAIILTIAAVAAAAATGNVC